MTETADQPRPLLVPTSVAAKLIDLDEDRVRELCRRGDLEAVRIPSREGVAARKIRITVASIERFVDRRVAEQCGDSPEDQQQDI